MASFTERKHHLNQVIQEAIKEAKKIIKDGSDGSEREIYFITIEVTKEFMKKVIHRFIKREPHLNQVVEKTIIEADKIIKDGSDGSEREIYFITTKVTKEFKEIAASSWLKKYFLNKWKE